MRLFISTLFIFGMISGAHAHTFSLGRSDVVGQVQTVVAKQGDTLAQVARDHDMGYEEMVEANPTINDPDHLAAGSVLIIPSQFVLPQAARNGIVVNLAEMRLYYYAKGTGQVVTHPMGIGREGEDTPLGVLSIIQHIPNPTWHVPESIRTMREAEGIFLPKAVPPGPENPLGNYAMRLSNPSYLIHGTNDPLGGIGRRSSSGCLRMYPEDIETLYRMVKNGTPVQVVNAPYKAGWSASGALYLESHVPLESKEEDDQNVARAHQAIQLAMQGRAANIDWDKVSDIAGETQGFPQVIGSTARKTAG